MDAAIQDFITGGSRKRRSARKISAASLLLAEQATVRADAADRQARTALEAFETERASVFAQHVVGQDRLYALAKMESPGVLSPAEVARLHKPVLVVTEQDVLPAILAIAFGAVVGALVGWLVAFALAKAGNDGQSALEVPAIVLLGLACALRAGQVQANWTLRAAIRYAEQVRKFDGNVKAFTELVGRICKGVGLRSHITKQLTAQLLEKRQNLNKVVMDAVNTAKLLRDVLDIALVNEEGALLDDVIAKLHGQRSRIGLLDTSLASQA